MLNSEPSSFRDNSGFIFYKENQPYRAIKNSYAPTFNNFNASGLYKQLLIEGLIIEHEELTGEERIKLDLPDPDIYKVLKIKKIPFITYPYEWSFGQLKQAALLTLKIQEIALGFNMSLKDASSFNVQFIGSCPVFIDTLSFEDYKSDAPWIAYGQFCRHFLAPLAILKYSTAEFNRLSQLFIDGIPLKVASNLLPFKTKFNSLLAFHLHFHSKLEQGYASKSKDQIKRGLNLSKKKLFAIISHLYKGIEEFSYKTKNSEWINYYSESSYSDASVAEKSKIIENWLKKMPSINLAWDLGSNTGYFSEILSGYSKYTLALDIDYVAIEAFFNKLMKKEANNILPIVFDLSNPSPSIGWANEERKTLGERGKADLIMALALIHHVCIGNNIPLEKFAEYLSRSCVNLIIEFVPKGDDQTQRLLVTREDIFGEYTLENFEISFKKYFQIIEIQLISGTQRILYLMRRNF